MDWTASEGPLSDAKNAPFITFLQAKASQNILGEGFSQPLRQDGRVFQVTLTQLQELYENTQNTPDKGASVALSDGDSSTHQRSSLITLAILFFNLRDRLVFEWFTSTPLYPKLSATKPLRQIPTLKQLQALLTSRKDALDRDEALLIDTIEAFSDENLGVNHLRNFRESLLQPPLPEGDHNAPWAQEMAKLLNEALTGWNKLQNLSKALRQGYYNL